MSDETTPATGDLVVAGAPPTTIGELRVSEAAAAFLDGLHQKPQVPAALPLITINHKDGGFALPTGEVVEAVSGYPIYLFRTRRYYKAMYDPRQKGNPPDCWSADMVRPHESSTDRQAEVCAECPMNQFATARDGRSKACGEYAWVFLYNPAFGDPPISALVVPPSSLRALFGTRFESGYLEQAKRRYGAFQLAWSTFRLEPVQGGVHCILRPHMGAGIQDTEQATRLRDFVNHFTGRMESLRLQTPAIEGGEA